MTSTLRDNTSVDRIYLTEQGCGFTRVFPDTQNNAFWGTFNQDMVTCTGFYTKLNVWGSLGLNFDYDGGPINENGGPIFQYVYIIGFVLLIIKSRYTRQVSQNIRSFSYLNHL